MKGISWGIEISKNCIRICGFDVYSKKIVFYRVYPTPYVFYQNYIKDFYGLLEFLERVFMEIERENDFQIKELTCCLNTKLLNVKNSSFSYALTEGREKIITSKDIEYLIRQALLLGTGWQEKVIYKSPQYFYIDGVQNVKSPLGMWARTLGVDMLILSIPYTFYENIKKLFEYLGKQLISLLVSGYTSYIGSQIEDKDFLFIDIGEEITDIMIFKEGSIVYFDNLEFGSICFDECISKDLKISLDLAKNIRKDFLDLDYPEEEIIVKSQHSYAVFSSRAIIDTVRLKIDEFVDKIEKKISRFNLSKEVNWYISGEVISIGGFIKQLSFLFDREIKTPSLKFTIEKKFPADSRIFPSLGCCLWNVSNYKPTSLFKKKITSFLNFLKDLYRDYF